MSMDLAKKTFSTQPDYLIAGNAEIVTAVKEASAALKRGAPVVLNSDGKLAAISVSGSSATAIRTARRRVASFFMGKPPCSAGPADVWDGGAVPGFRGAAPVPDRNASFRRLTALLYHGAQRNGII